MTDVAKFCPRCGSLEHAVLVFKGQQVPQCTFCKWWSTAGYSAWPTQEKES